MSSKSREEPKLTLPVGHPQAGYLSPDLSGTDGVTAVDEEKEKELQETAEANQAVLDNEDKVAREEAKAAADEAKPEQQPTRAKSSLAS